MKLLEDIYFGNLAPNEITIEKGSEMDIQLKRIIKIEEDFVMLLRQEGRELFEKLKLEQSKMNILSECKAFENGVRFGVELMIETFVKKDKPEE